MVHTVARVHTKEFCQTHSQFNMSATDMLIFTVSIISTDNPKKSIQMPIYIALAKLNFMPRSALLQNHAEWFLNYFYLVSLRLLQCIQAITIFTFMESSYISSFYGLDRHENLRKYTI